MPPHHLTEWPGALTEWVAAAIIWLAGPIVVAFLGGCGDSSPPSQPDRVVPRLVELLQDSDPEVRRTAAESLGKIASPTATAALVLSLTDPDPLVRQYSAWALGNVGEDALDEAAMPLLARLEDPDDEVKAAAALALGQIGGTQVVVELLAEALRHPHPATRRGAAQALGWLEATSAFPALIRSLKDRDARVRQAVITALGELADPRVLPDLVDRLRKDPDRGVRSEAAFRLGKLGQVSSLPPLRAAAANDPDPGVRRWAAWAAGQLSPSDGPGSTP